MGIEYIINLIEKNNNLQPYEKKFMIKKIESIKNIKYDKIEIDFLDKYNPKMITVYISANKEKRNDIITRTKDLININKKQKELDKLIEDINNNVDNLSYYFENNNIYFEIKNDKVNRATISYIVNINNSDILNEFNNIYSEIKNEKNKILNGDFNYHYKYFDISLYNDYKYDGINFYGNNYYYNITYNTKYGNILNMQPNSEEIKEANLKMIKTKILKFLNNTIEINEFLLSYALRDKNTIYRKNNKRELTNEEILIMYLYKKCGMIKINDEIYKIDIKNNNIIINDEILKHTNIKNILSKMRNKEISIDNNIEPYIAIALMSTPIKENGKFKLVNKLPNLEVTLDGTIKIKTNDSIKYICENNEQIIEKFKKYKE